MRPAGMLLGVVLLLAPAGAMAPEPSEAQGTSDAAARMKALEFLVGEWEGEAWVQMGPGPRETVRQREWVEWEVDGEVLLIRGLGMQADPQSGEERIGHQALATVAWDPERQVYEMWSYARGRGTGHRDIEVRDRGFVWIQTVPGGKARYTMRLDEQGRWLESGEFTSDDGATWHLFLEMTLTRR